MKAKKRAFFMTGIIVASTLFLFGGFCLESPSAMLVGIAKGQAGRGEYDKAIVSFNKALEMSPNSWYVLLNRGEFYLEIKRYEEAAADLTRVIELHPKYVYIYKIHTMRGDSYRYLFRHDEAIAEYGRALDIRPNYAPARYGRGLTYWETGRRTEALADLGRACGLKYEPACKAYEALAADRPGGNEP
ncbi:MAG: tetratricopeptide repeat protein [Deltaproteobacteria bacterium]|nr:tetratricopeptide repeat protein [Candidatus Zymogenaceae bacterium]